MFAGEIAESTVAPRGAMLSFPLHLLSCRCVASAALALAVTWCATPARASTVVVQPIWIDDSAAGRVQVDAQDALRSLFNSRGIDVIDVATGGDETEGQVRGWILSCNQEDCYRGVFAATGARALVACHVALLSPDFLITAHRVDLETGERVRRSGIVATGGHVVDNEDIVKVVEGLFGDEGSAGDSTLCRLGDEADCRTQCDAGHAASCWILAEMYRAGRGVEQDEERFGELAGQACEREVGAACASLARINLEQRKVRESVQLERRACAAGYANSCGRLGLAYERGKLGRREPTTAAEYLRSACEGGARYFCIDLGELYEQGDGLPKDGVVALDYYHRGVEYLEWECDNQSGFHCARLGARYRHGRWGGEVNNTLAGRYYTYACDHGYRQACDTSPKYIKARCAKGAADACERVADLYHNGDLGVPRDDAEALRYLERSCTGGHEPACARSLTALGKRCAAGQHTRCNDLAELYRRGTWPATRDFERAAELYTQACKLGNEGSCTMLELRKLAGDLGWRDAR